MEERIKISDKDYITFQLTENDITLMIKYNKRSELQTRFKIIDKFKEVLRKI